ncbi:MAG: hypothetical protein ASARMPRED_008187 [Alectoria sarmentosa]|nr:MAG: hypothetical protein ASARMPRED_008187 [Alectoria sarmentosa]
MENRSQFEPQPREPSSFLPAATTSKPKDPITCHVLDLVSGVPAPGLSVALTLLKPFGPSAAFKALTNADGRISSWEAPDGPSLAEIFENLHEHPDGGMVWSLKFETGKYYGEDTRMPNFLIHTHSFPTAIVINMSNAYTTYFVPGYGISRHIMFTHIQYHLGPYASVRPFTYQQREGYLISNPGSALTKSQIEDLQYISRQYEQQEAERMIRASGALDRADVYINRPIPVQQRYGH